MKTFRLLALLLLLPAFGEPATLPDASLDGLWFKLTLKCSGRAVASDGSDIHKQSVSMPAYLNLVVNESAATGEAVAPSTNYTRLLYTEFLPDMWGSSAPQDIGVVVTSKDQYILPNLEAVAQSE